MGRHRHIDADRGGQRVLFTALATLGAFIYNVCADLVGGIELTSAERD